MNGRARERTVRLGLDFFLRLVCGETGEIHKLAARFWRLVELALVTSLALLILMLAGRRLAGALERPLSPLLLIASGLVLVVWSAAIRQARAARVQSTTQPTYSTLPNYLPTLLLAFGGLVLSLPGTGPLALACFWLLLTAAELWQLNSAWNNVGEPSDPREPGQPPHAFSTGTVIAERIGAHDELPGPVEVAEAEVDQEVDQEVEDAELDESLPDEDVEQQMVCRRLPDGTQAIAGTLRAHFAAQQRSVTAHLAFCPAFSRTPVISAAAVAGPGAQVRVVQVLAYGARLDVKLDAPGDEPSSVLVGFEANEQSA